MRPTHILLAALLLSACGSANEGAGTQLTEQPLTVADRPVPGGQPAARIAYVYDFTFQLPEARIAGVQARHLALCDRLGPRCHLRSMEQARGPAEAGGAMELAVAAPLARSFGNALVNVVANEGGETTGRTIAGEDLSKQIVDVEARLRGRQALADRLLQVVRSHNGSVADLVAAEKSLADVQQEIDTARAELADATGRVAMSTVRIDYRTDASLGGFTAPIVESFRNMASLAGGSVAALLGLLAMLLPWAALLGLLGMGYRHWRRRRARTAFENTPDIVE